MQPAIQDATREFSGTVTCSALPYPARAWWGDVMVAQSTGAVRVDIAGEPPVLCFPAVDVRLDVVASTGPAVACAAKGVLRLGSLPGEAANHRLGAWSPDKSVPRTVDGAGAVWTFAAPSPQLAAVTGFVAFDHDRVRVELIDAVPGEDGRDATVKRWPIWGDAADLVAIMDVRPAGERRYVGGGSPDTRRPVVEASQLLGQAIVAASRHAPGRRVVSAHMVFFRGADAREPLELELEEFSSGRTFTALGVQVVQGGRPRAAGTLLLDATAADVFRHETEAPKCAGPYDSEPYDMGVTGRDLRVVDGAYTDDPDAPVGPPVIDAWVRFRDVPADPPLHAGLLAQFTGHMSIAAAMRPHAGIGQTAAHRTLSTGINALSIALHCDIRADRWMRYHHLSTFAGDGMTHAECRVYDEDGGLLASFTVEAMVRAMPGGSAADARNAM